MNCYDCHPKPEIAVAVCHLCGKGLCYDHCLRQERTVLRHVFAGMAAQVRATGRTVPRMVCADCHAGIGQADAEGHLEIR